MHKTVFKIGRGEGKSNGDLKMSENDVWAFFKPFVFLKDTHGGNLSF